MCASNMLICVSNTATIQHRLSNMLLETNVAATCCLVYEGLKEISMFYIYPLHYTVAKYTVILVS